MHQPYSFPYISASRFLLNQTTSRLTQDVKGIDRAVGSKGIKVEAPETHAGAKAMKEYQRDIFGVFVKAKCPHMRLLLPHHTVHTYIPTSVAGLQVCGRMSAG